MKTEMVLFFELLHKARALKKGSPIRRMYILRGYRLALRTHLADIKAGQNIQDFWLHQQSGAEG